MVVHIPQPLLSYTNQQPKVEAQAASVDELLDVLDARYPGIRFRMIDEQGALRPHIRIFVNRERTADLATSLVPTDEVHILPALSGG